MLNEGEHGGHLFRPCSDFERNRLTIDLAPASFPFVTSGRCPRSTQPVSSMPRRVRAVSRCQSGNPEDATYFYGSRAVLDFWANLQTSAGANRPLDACVNTPAF